ncbi:hypothetical protein GYB22_10255 [bacterium]|nr:hypothetical protein [bacterium]
MKKAFVFIVIFSAISIMYSCSSRDAAKSNSEETEPEMYEASEMSLLMRDMVEFSKAAKSALEQGKEIGSVPAHFYDLKKKKATRDEQEDEAFQAMADQYLKSLKGIDRGDSSAYYYNLSISNCKTCHSSYCGGPMAVISKLDYTE